MANSILEEFWLKCNSKERAALANFARSPFFNKQQALLCLFETLPSLSYSEFPDKAQLFALAYPDSAYDYAKYRYLVSDAASLILRYWTITSYEADHRSVSLDQMNVLSLRGLPKSYSHRFKQESKQLKKLVQVNDFFYQMQLTALDEQHFERQGQRIFDTRIKHAAVALDKFYFLQRLVYACGMLDREAIFSTHYTYELPLGWFEYLQQQDFFHEPIILMYGTIWRMLMQPESEAHFHKLLELLNTFPEHQELRTPYLSAINFSLRKIRQGNLNFIPKALYLYETGIAKGILTQEDGSISPWTMTNVVKLALRQARYNWAKKFIDENIHRIPIDFRENALAYNLAEYYYYSKDYDQAKETLFQVEFNDINYYLGARVILAKIYYEEQDTEPLVSLLASFAIFLRRNKAISSTIKSSYLNFCKVLSKLANSHAGQKEKIRQQIGNMSLLNDREWLLRQLDLL